MFGALNYFLTGAKKAGVTATYLVVAGGGSGGRTGPGGGSGGGGGAGEVIYGTGLSLSFGTSYGITIGAGGASVTTNVTSGINGNNSSFASTVVALGGGGGGAYNDTFNGKSGGSGGGGCYYASTTGGASTTGTLGGGTHYGNAGGAGAYLGEASGGGGGAGTAGAAAIVNNGGNGGDGQAFSISGSSVTYGGGGGGGTYTTTGTTGAGGSGGGGASSVNPANSISGTINTGGGGGGVGDGLPTSGNSGAGGSGVVIISIPNTYVAVFSSGCTVTSTVSGGNNIYTVTATSTTSETVKFITPPVIGSALGGGYFAGFISTSGNGVANYYLIVAPKSSGESQSSAFGPGTPAAPGTSDIDGPANSTAMNSTTYPAAYFCKGLTIGGFSDWYSPATNELEVCYYNLKPGTHTNNTGSGINPNAVPARSSNYTSGNPAQTSATLFQVSGGQDFGQVNYWTSVQDPSITNRGKIQSFYTGSQGSLYKPSFGYNYRIRAVRRVAV